MARPRRKAPPVNAPANALRVLYLEKGTSEVVRIRDRIENGVILGCLTHYDRKTVWCRGPDCPSSTHRKPIMWVGFIDGDRWEPLVKKWVRTVIQVTESLEQDFRHRVARGQMWELWRENAPEGVFPPWQGKLVREQIADELEEPYPVLPHVMRTLNCLEVQLNRPNPMPPREIVAYVDGTPPPFQVDAAKPQAKPDPEVRRKFLDWQARRGTQFTPEEKKETNGHTNGTGHKP